jgi:hypothetical protein
MLDCCPCPYCRDRRILIDNQNPVHVVCQCLIAVKKQWRLVVLIYLSAIRILLTTSQGDVFGILHRIADGTNVMVAARSHGSNDDDDDLHNFNSWPSYQARMEHFYDVMSAFNDSALTTTDSTFLADPDDTFGNYTTSLFTVWLDEPMPFSHCFPASHLPHPLVYEEHHPAHAFNRDGKEPYRNGSDPISICSGPQFTQIKQRDEQVVFSMQCPDAWLWKVGQNLERSHAR